MKKFIIPILALATLSGCATGKTISQTPIDSLALAPGKGRIAVYRTSVVGFAIQPSVKVDGRKTDSCTPNSVFYVDVAPGVHEVSATTEATDTATVNVRANRTSYVECSINMGILVGRPAVIEVTASRAKPRVEKLSFQGKY